jgi:hypothetical protein
MVDYLYTKNPYLEILICIIFIHQEKLVVKYT